MPNNATVLKAMQKLKLLKIKDFITLQNILFINDCLEEEKLKRFNNIFKQMETNLFQSTRSINTQQLKRLFLNKKYGHLSIFRKCLLEPTPKCIKN